VCVYLCVRAHTIERESEIESVRVRRRQRSVGGLRGERTRERGRLCVFDVCVGERDTERDSVCVHACVFYVCSALMPSVRHDSITHTHTYTHKHTRI